jgi:hypothetical protein
MPLRWISLAVRGLKQKPNLILLLTELCWELVMDASACYLNAYLIPLLHSG